MRPVTEREIRTSFVNCSKGEAKRLGLPKDFATLPWDDLDFLGWRDPGAPERAYLVAQHDDRLVGIGLRRASGTSRGFTSRSMCSLCLTTRTGGAVALMTARRMGEAGRQGNSVGQYVCDDLDCSLYVRGKKHSVAGGEFEESLTRDEKVARIQANLHTFLDKITRSH
ncbi:FBP domain-containing protein [Actinomadura darangshiensis]|uniref:FBP domain-containing protein n=1 Tax=Actinomadura darangshiensis TaxID=705336 RepID=A0A4R5BA41_9ACTN|nr:FBP domain-containing protein [Actinomadura darangshiensis]TDD82355.1 FBP domain-containing protein [Actinomadura darangshiensis]